MAIVLIFASVRGHYVYLIAFLVWMTVTTCTAFRRRSTQDDAFNRKTTMLTSEEAAAEIGTTLETIGRLVWLGKLPSSVSATGQTVVNIADLYRAFNRFPPTAETVPLPNQESPELPSSIIFSTRHLPALQYRPRAEQQCILKAALLKYDKWWGLQHLFLPPAILILVSASILAIPFLQMSFNGATREDIEHAIRSYPQTWHIGVVLIPGVCLGLIAFVWTLNNGRLTKAVRSYLSDQKLAPAYAAMRGRSFGSEPIAPEKAAPSSDVNAFSPTCARFAEIQERTMAQEQIAIDKTSAERGSALGYASLGIAFVLMSIFFIFGPSTAENPPRTEIPPRSQYLLSALDLDYRKAMFEEIPKGALLRTAGTIDAVFGKHDATASLMGTRTPSQVYLTFAVQPRFMAGDDVVLFGRYDGTREVQTVWAGTRLVPFLIVDHYEVITPRN